MHNRNLPVDQPDRPVPRQAAGIDAAEAGRKKCYSIDEEPAYLKPAYRRFALISDRRQLDLIDTADNETLIVVSDWLLWQKCIRNRIHCALASRGIPGWRDLRSFGANYYLLSNDWLYVNGEDATLFHGVSLGRKFIRQISLVVADYEVKRQALEILTERFAPREYVYFDYRTDDDFLGDSDRFAIVRSVAEQFDIDIIDRRDRSGPENAEFSVYSAYKSERKNSRKSLRSKIVEVGLAVFEGVTDGLSRLRRLFGGNRPRVLMLISHMAAIPLIRKFDGRAIYPMLMAWLFPYKKKPGFVADCIARGILLISAPRKRLSRDEHLAVDSICTRLEDAWASDPAVGRQAIVRSHVRENILNPEYLHDKAVEVCWADRVLARHEPDLIFTDSLQNSAIITFLELAKIKNIPAAATWHGPYIQDVKFDIFGCDQRLESLVDTCFTWGKNHEDWLDNTSATTKKVRIGNPVCSIYRDMPRKPPENRNALVLQYIGPGHDFEAPTSHEYLYFVHTVRILKDLGYTNIRLKFHPGLSKTGYYEQIADYFDVSCEMIADQPFPDMVAWADFIIGPVVSGAMLEVLSAGKTFYPVLLPPHSVNETYLEGETIYSEFQSLRRDLEDNDPLDQQDLLDKFISNREYPDSASRVWEVLNGTPHKQP